MINSYKNKGFFRIDKLLKQSAKHHKFEALLSRHQALTSWNSVAQGFLAEATKQTKALNFNRGVLTVACLTKEIASQLRLLAQRIIEALNLIIGRQLVFALYLEV